ncbi:MAG: hypothetical protein JO353_00050, partial [Phycisphaerae bacterium]|nr:hypothetical protein [Phycisphaerae bacterium]
MATIRVIFCLLLAASLCAGCQALGAVAGKVAGTPPVPAKYVPNKVPTLVLADRTARANVDDAATEDMGRRVANIWQRQKIAPLIEPANLAALRSSMGRQFDQLSIDAIGKKLGADQVLYI